MSTCVRASVTCRFTTRHSRVSCSPTIRASTDIGISGASAITYASKSSVKPLPGRAHGTSTFKTPCSPHFTRGIRATRYVSCSKKLRCRHVCSSVSCALHGFLHSGHGSSPPRSKSSRMSRRPRPAFAPFANSIPATRHGGITPSATSNSFVVSIDRSYETRQTRLQLLPTPNSEEP